MPPFAHAGSTCWNLSGHIAASHVAPWAINAAAPCAPDPAIGVETPPAPTAAAPLEKPIDDADL